MNVAEARSRNAATFWSSPRTLDTETPKRSPRRWKKSVDSSARTRPPFCLLAP